MSAPLKILVVDDSLVFRSAIREALRGYPGVQVVGSVRNGLKAMEFILQDRPDLVTLDVEMPDLNGVQTLKAIQEFNDANPSAPPIRVIMVSAHTRAGARITIEALEAGAFDFIAKPNRGKASENQAQLRERLHQTLVALGAGSGAPEASSATPAPLPLPVPARPGFNRTGLRPVLIGVSTGGPNALARLLPELTACIDEPVLVAQHMPPLFTRSLAASLDQKCRHRVIEAEGGEPVSRRTVYMAPGGRHMLVRQRPDGNAVIALSDQAPENNCRPSVDVLFRSAAEVFGDAAVALVLTGMGSDGTQGLLPLCRAGARAIAQDRESSVVWGMPGSAVAAGLIDQVLPLSEIPSAIARLLEWRRATACG